MEKNLKLLQEEFQTHHFFESDLNS